MQKSKAEPQSEAQAEPIAEPKVPDARDVYQEHVRTLSTSQRLRLLRMIVEDLICEAEARTEKPPHDIRELHGLGAEIWQGVDAQEYVNRVRDGLELIP